MLVNVIFQIEEEFTDGLSSHLLRHTLSFFLSLIIVFLLSPVNIYKQQKFSSKYLSIEY